MECVLLDPELLSLEAETVLAGRMISLFWIQVIEIKFRSLSVDALVN